MVAVLERTPPWHELPGDTPPSIRRLLRWCLDKDSRRRLRDIGHVRLEMDNTEDGTEAIDRSTRLSNPMWWRLIPWVSTAAIVVTALVVLGDPASEPEVTRFTVGFTRRCLLHQRDGGRPVT